MKSRKKSGLGIGDWGLGNSAIRDSEPAIGKSPIPNPQSPIFLVGFMGSGKSFIGEKLATRLGWIFVDLDHFIEQKTGKTIFQIFAEGGEPVFRTIEKQSLFQLFLLKNVVVATGGGTPCFFENMAAMNKNGLTFFLKTPPELLALRLFSEMENRPLIADLSADELPLFIENKLAERTPFYMQARFVVEQTDDSEAAIKAILQLLESKK